MSKKKNPLIITAAATVALLGLAIIVVAALAVAGVITIDRPANGNIDKNENPAQSAVIEEEKNKDLLWQTAEASAEDVTAVIETAAGSFTLKLYPGAAADKFAALGEGGAFSSGEFSVLAKDMFIQCAPLSEESFGAEKNDLGCFYGAVGFVMENGMVTDSLFAVTAKSLSAGSRAFIEENAFSAERAELYESLGGMPEYEGKVMIFGQVTEGFDTLDSIAAGKTNSYTGGYAAESPVKIISVTINRPAEEGGGAEPAE